MSSAEESAAGSAPVGFHGLLKAARSEAERVCASAFGETTELSDLFGVGLTFREGGEGGPCVYDTADGGRVLLSVLDFRPPALPVFALTATGEQYSVAVVTEPPAPPALADPERRVRLQAWFDARAHAVVDDYDEWLATLPAVDEGFLALGGYELDPFGLGRPHLELDGRLVTPTRTVAVTGVRRVGYLQFDEDSPLVRAGDGREFLITTLVSELHASAPDARVAIRARVAGADVGAVPLPVATPTAAHSDVATDLVLSVPVGATDVELVVVTDGVEQAISLTDGAERQGV